MIIIVHITGNPHGTRHDSPPLQAPETVPRGNPDTTQPKPKPKPLPLPVAEAKIKSVVWYFFSVHTPNTFQVTGPIALSSHDGQGGGRVA